MHIEKDSVKGKNKSRKQAFGIAAEFSWRKIMYMRILFLILTILSDCKISSREEKEKERRKNCLIGGILAEDITQRYKNESDENKKRELSDQSFLIIRVFCPINE